MVEPFARPLTREEMDAMRRAARDEESITGSFWGALKRVVHKLPFAEDLVAAFLCAKDPQTPARVRYLLLSALGYFILPIDALPDIMPLLGFSDDIAMLAAAIAAVAGSIKPEHRLQARQILEKLR
ncbi:YkvA family protein [Pseudochelatococcus sp. G4_1912]|uniref:YkvA family protein n=1 Tax=Pseudochelatococcus sp. G4_1912 TaxID=3114288 RepID=UPI0039C6758A